MNNIQILFQYATVLSLALAVSGCETFMQDQETMSNIARTNQRVKISKEARDFCENEPMVGIQKGFNALINLKRSELQKAEGEIELSRYSRLSQKLEGYSVEYELTNQQMVVACRQHAICLISHSTYGACKNANQDYQEKLDKAGQLLVTLRELEISN